MPSRDPDALIAAGMLAEAAEALQAQGEHARAADLFEQLWDFPAASWAARTAGDLPRALENALGARDQSTATELADQAMQQGGEVVIRCAEVCQQRGALALAARLHEAAGDLGQAVQCLEQAGLWLEAARCHEALGDARAAMEALGRQLSTLEGDEAADGDTLASVPRYELGRLLMRHGRTEEALPLLQRASREGDEVLAPRAGRAVAAALARLGYGHAAEVALGLLPGQRPTLEQCLGDPALATMTGDAGEGRVLAGRYRLGELLGAGGMGSVYRGTDLLTEQQVAVKIFTAPGGTRGRDAFHRFVREARTTGELRHPRIVSLLDFNEDMGFMVLEYMAGGTLSERLRPAMDLPACRATMLQVLEGLMAAHQRGVVHRDIKPSNIFFTPAGAAKLGDFGVAHLQDTGQTQTGAFIGTLAFMSPEQISGAPVSFATDIYALGVTLYLMITGQLPFSPPDLVNQHLWTPAPRPSRLCPDLPVMVDQVVLRCMAKEPGDRFESLEQLRQAVESFPTASDITVTAPGAEPEQKPSRPRRATDSRFTVESEVFNSDHLQILEARDNNLGRPVMLVRAAKTPARQRVLALLEAAAKGGVNLQRVLSLDRDRGQAVLQARMGKLAPPPTDRRSALSLCEGLGRALIPLHQQGLAHGAVCAEAVTEVAHWTMLDLVPALTAGAGAGATVQGDVEAALELASLPRVEGVEDGAALERWALEQMTHDEVEASRQRRERLLQEALDDAPDGVEHQ